MNSFYKTSNRNNGRHITRDVKLAEGEVWRFTLDFKTRNVIKQERLEENKHE